MNALGQLQLAFQRYVLHGDEAMRERVVRPQGSDPEHRLRIYYDAYRLRLIEALATDYEALRAIMGPEAFNAACRAYIEATASIFRNVRWYGAGLSRFLRETPPWSEQLVLAEIAWFEWTLTLTFDASDQQPLSFDAVAAISAERWPALRFVLHACVHLITLRTNAPAFRKAADAGEPLPPVNSGELVSWLIWRNEHTPCFRSLSEPEAWALRAVQNQENFTALCEGLCEWFGPEQAAPQAAGLLQRWVNDGLVVAAFDSPTVEENH
jgi:hypothetical protein